MDPAHKTNPRRLSNLYIERLLKQEADYHAHRRFPWPWIVALAVLVGFFMLWSQKPARHVEKNRTAVAHPPSAAASVRAVVQSAPAQAPPRRARTEPVQWKGPYCAIADFRIAAVRTAAEWRDLLQAMGIYGPAMEVDFKNSMVVGIFMGDRPSGYEVTLLDPVENDSAVKIPFKVTARSGGAEAKKLAATRPFHLMVIPRTDKRVRFRRVTSE